MGDGGVPLFCEYVDGLRHLVKHTTEPDISNNVGPVKSFFEHTSPFTPKSGLLGPSFTSASTTTARS